MKAYFNEQLLEIYETTVYPAPYLRHEVGRFVNFRLYETGTLNKGTLKIECDTTPQSVIIRPKRLGITAKIIGNTIEIPLDKPCNFSVEPNGDIVGRLMVFANGENDINVSDYENIIRFERGQKFVDVLKITEDNTLLYLDDGAYLDGKVIIENCNNVAICGGIISMEKYFRRCNRNNCVQIKNCKNVKVRDLTVLDSCNWSMQLMGCDNVSIDNYHVIGLCGNSDGLDVCGSRNVRVMNCFTRVWDDSLVVKAFDTGNIENIVFENEPKTKITKIELTPSLSGEMIVSLDKLGIENINTFWLDAEVETDIEKRYPLCLFASQVPEKICHMFVNVRRD